MNPFGVNEDSNGGPAPTTTPNNPFSGSKPASPSPFASPTSIPDSPAAPQPKAAVEPVPVSATPPVAPLPAGTTPSQESVSTEESLNNEVPQAIDATPSEASTPQPVEPSDQVAQPAPPVSAEPAPTFSAEPQAPAVLEPPALAAPADSMPAATAPEAESTEPPAGSPYPIAWQPFTFSGIAAFAHASVNRLLLLQLLIALLVGVTGLWFVDRNYSPVLVAAMKKMPDEASIRRGILLGAPSQLLAENKFLSISIDLLRTDGFGQSADMQVELHRQDVRLSSIFSSTMGVLPIPYPPLARVSMGEAALEPWWGAWHPIFYVGIVVGLTLALMITWTLLATIYALVPRLVAYYADRALRSDQAWNVAGAALMPGALIMELGIVLYGLGFLDLIGLGMFTAVHFVVGWIYAIGAPFFLPRREDSPAPNPFND